MKNYKYGKTSLDKIKSTRIVIQELCHEAIRIANERKMYVPDFGISSGFRTEDEQRLLYMDGRNMLGEVIDSDKVVTNTDGVINMSKHQTGLAVDFYAIKNGKADYSDESMALVATCFLQASVNLGTLTTWGGSFKSFVDSGHIELKI